MNDTQSVLVFPAGMPDCQKWALQASAMGVRVVGASSLPFDPAKDRYAEWTFLPWIRDPEFGEALGRCLREKRIDAVYTSHPVVWPLLRDLLPKVAEHTRLESERPWDSDFKDYRGYWAKAQGFLDRPLEIAVPACAPPVPAVQLASLVRMFQLVPGQCDFDKLEALLAVFRRMPPGDVVEVGSLWGRSAVALAFLARHYGTGKLLCVDPWRDRELHQSIAEVDAISHALPIDEIFDAFRVNLAGFDGWVNYLRLPSTEAADAYRREERVATDDFGETAYQGRIALLHIDGNHAIDAVRADIAAWKPFVRHGGWIVFDDYHWPFGDGPAIAADEFRLECGLRAGVAFVAGGALFVQVDESLWKM
jgi:hypothetical protein